MFFFDKETTSIFNTTLDILDIFAKIMLGSLVFTEILILVNISVATMEIFLLPITEI